MLGYENAKRRIDSGFLLDLRFGCVRVSARVSSRLIFYFLTRRLFCIVDFAFDRWWIRLPGLEGVVLIRKYWTILEKRICELLECLRSFSHFLSLEVKKNTMTES